MTDKYPIDLGKKPPGDPSPTVTSLSKEKYYPSLHLEWPDDYDLPKSGTMEITFVKTSETKTTHNGKTSYNVTLEIKTIEEVSDKSGDEEDADEGETDESTGDRLDKMAKDAEDQAEGE
jgi:hypothetical protein